MKNNRMTTQQIVKKSGFAQLHNMSFEKLYLVMNQTIQDGNFRIMRAGNVLFWYELDKSGTAEFWMMNGGHPKDLPDAYVEFYNAMGVSGFKNLSTLTNSVDEVKTMHRAGLPIKVTVVEMDRQGGHTFKVDIPIQ